MNQQRPNNGMHPATNGEAIIGDSVVAMVSPRRVMPGVRRHTRWHFFFLEGGEDYNAYAVALE